jgi:hypothetical protein
MDTNRINWRNVEHVIAYAQHMGLGTLVVQWPGRTWYNITQYVANYDHVRRMGGRIMYITGRGDP